MKRQRNRLIGRKYRIMVLLHELCDDVLHLIISNLASDFSGSTDLRSLALTCRSISKLARPAVPRNISIGIPSTQFHLLKRSLDENQAYGHRVLSLSRRWVNYYALRFDGLLCPFLQQLPNLRSYTSKSCSDEHQLLPLLLSSHVTLRHTLQDLSLDEGLPTALDLLHLASLPRIRNICITYIKTIDVSSKVIVSNIFTTQSVLQLLDLSCSQIGHRALKAILQHSHCVLKELLCNVPLKRKCVEDRKSLGVYMKCSLSPMRIMQTLAPAAQTLRKLELYTRQQEWADHDGTRMNLNSFVALKELRASALCFLAPLSLDISRDGLYKLLPKSLKLLHLDFEHDIGIFYSTINQKIEEEGRSRFLAEDIDASYYHWIVELAEHKFDCLPLLLRVMLYEDVWQRGPLFALDEWEAPLPVDWAFDEAGIDLDVRVRAPKRY